MLALRSVCLLPLFMITGCNGILWGNLGVFCVTVGIFLGTVFLSRTSSAAQSASRSTASSTTPRS